MDEIRAMRGVAAMRYKELTATGTLRGAFEAVLLEAIDAELRGYALPSTFDRNGISKEIAAGVMRRLLPG